MIISFNAFIKTKNNKIKEGIFYVLQLRYRPRAYKAF